MSDSMDIKLHAPILKFSNNVNETKPNKDILREAKIRLCRLRTWPNYKGYGFEIRKSSKPPYRINLVESNSPASAGGLKIHDVLLSINDENVSYISYDHLLVVLHGMPEDIHHPIDLLVVDSNFYEILNKKNIVIDSSMATVINTPINMPESYMKYSKHGSRICQIQLESNDIHFGFDVVSGLNGIGMYIQDVVRDSPAYCAGLRKSDRIIEINDKYVNKHQSKLILEKLNKAVMKRNVKLLVEDTQTYRSHFRNNRNDSSTLSSQHGSHLELFSPPTHTELSLNSDKHDNKTTTSLVSTENDYEQCDSSNNQNKTPEIFRKEPVNVNRNNQNIPPPVPRRLHRPNSGYENPGFEDSSIASSYEIPLTNNQHQVKDTATMLVNEDDVASYVEIPNNGLYSNRNSHHIQPNVLKNGEYFKVDQRFFDVQNEPLCSSLPILGYETVSLVPLATAIKNLEAIIPSVKLNVLLVLDKSRNPTDGLTSDESASIQLYTMGCKSHKPLSTNLNDALRATNRDQLIPYLPYLKLILTALEKLENLNTIVWRGVKADLTVQYPVGKIFIWWGFSSCVESQNLLESDKYLGKQGIRTLFHIECKTGKSIHFHSYSKHINEILLLPGTQLQVIKQDKLTNDLYIIYLKEISSTNSLIQSSSSLDSDYSFVSYVVEKTNLTNKDLQNFIDKHKLDNSICFSQQTLTIDDIHLIINELHTNQSWHELSFDGMYLTEEHLKILMYELESNRTINSLQLKSNQLNDNTSSIITHALTINKSLKTLDLTDNQITDISAQAFVNILSISKNLLNLNLSFNPIGDNGIHIICSALQKNVTLKSLDLNRTNLTSKSVQMLASALESNTNLEILHLNENNLGNQSITVLSRLFVQNKQLNTLHLAMNNITSSGAIKISTLLQNSLIKLNISDNPLGDIGVISIVQALMKNTTLIELYLDSVRMTNDSLKELIKMIRTNNTLKYLSLKRNEINDHGMNLLLDGLQVNHVLTHLYLNNNEITDKYISNITTVLNNNPNFKCIHLSKNEIPEQNKLSCDNKTIENTYY